MVHKNKGGINCF